VNNDGEAIASHLLSATRLRSRSSDGASPGGSGRTGPCSRGDLRECCDPKEISFMEVLRL